jgi:hypothetical protein
MCTPATGGGSSTEVISSPWARPCSTCGVSPGSLWKSAIGMRRAWPSGATVSTWASSTRMATAMSLGCVAMQAVLPPMTASERDTPPIALQPLPGRRLLHGWAVS